MEQSPRLFPAMDPICLVLLQPDWHVLENTLQDIILLWQRVGLDDHFHLSFLSIQGKALEALSLSCFVFAI